MKDCGGKWIKSENGLTLLELTLALALFGILALVSLNLLYYGVTTSKVVEDKVEIINNMNYALGIISKAIRETNNADEIDIKQDTSDLNILELPGNITFRAQDGVIKKIDINGTQNLTTKDKMQVVRLCFKKVGTSRNISIELTARSRDGQEVESRLEAAVRSDI